MANYQLPSIYLGVKGPGRDLYEDVMKAYRANAHLYPSLNQFLRHLIQSALKSDRTLKKAA